MIVVARVKAELMKMVEVVVGAVVVMVVVVGECEEERFGMRK